MSAHPLSDFGEVGFYGSGVEEIARGVACVHGSVYVVGLELEHADAVIQLSGDAQGLITSGIISDSEGRVVRADFSDIRVASCTEFGVVVAWLCV